MEIDIILTRFRRPEYLERQLLAIRAQTVPLGQVLVWNNGPDAVSPDSIGVDRVINCAPNIGVWARFLMPLEMSAEFVCVFDDDTIPGERWLENCLESFRARPGLYGTSGIRFLTDKRDPHQMAGWKSWNVTIEEVDQVGHAWFFPRDWARHFAAYPRLAAPTVYEDLHFSAALQSIGLPTLVPPHPVARRELWGSLDGAKLGADGRGLWEQPGEEEKKVEAHAKYREAGWRTIIERAAGK